MSDTMTYECLCGHKFEQESWTSGLCPKCKRAFMPDEDAGGNMWVEFESYPGAWDDE